MIGNRARIHPTQRGAASLRSILLLFTGTLLLLVLAAGFVTSFGYFRTYVSEQLAGHAQDGATAVGLSLSNAIDGRDPVASASLIDAVFDSGRYLSVRYLDLNGEEIAGRTMPTSELPTPGWFRSLADLDLTAGEAEVVQGWNRLGTVEVVSNPKRAYQDLWRITLGLVVGTLVIGGLGLFVLFLLLTRTLMPLRALEQQARALGQRDFRKRVTTQSTRELNQVTAAMNQMADDLGRLFDGQGKLIAHLRRVNNEDPITGLASQRAFDQRLKTEVESEERAAPGVLVLIKFAHFAEYNQSFGRNEANRLLSSMAKSIGAFVTSHAGTFAGRRNGAEFSLFIPGAQPADAKIWCDELLQRLDGLYADLASPLAVAVHAGIAPTGAGRGIRELFASADEALRSAQERGGTCCVLSEPDSEGHHNLETWRAIIAQAIRDQSLAIWMQPMVSEHHPEPIYHQVFSRLDGPEVALKASAFVPLAERFGLIGDIDRQVIRKVLARLRREPTRALAISLGGASVASEAFRDDMLTMLAACGDERINLWVGISEHTIHHHRKEAGILVKALVRLGVPVLVDRFGVGGVPFSYLRNLTVQALRIDNTFVHDIDTHDDNRFYVESVLSIAHSRGVKVFATGVETAAEYSVLCELGIDGAMGYHLGRPYAADNQ
ncbi:EAL domain-containing protein [Marinobacter salinisoli]|uniref:EAL domain-containing protein n=1 Tax=Marinobacter salinisoli TaxID=2769486 RepID=A0ABX7MUJ5_9GAMM|nr:EAL domain-containing protein [Marinobacter salinisoli]QSP95162.1 EAL domain-containing protein [Marinobacter salinisoli]